MSLYFLINILHFVINRILLVLFPHVDLFDARISGTAGQNDEIRAPPQERFVIVVPVSGEDCLSARFRRAGDVVRQCRGVLKQGDWSSA